MAYKPITMDTFQLRPPSERRRPPFFQTERVAFVGMTPSHVWAPWHDKRWTIAVHPCCHTIVQREPDWWFDLHPPSCFRKDKRWHRNYLKWLQHLRTPIFMQKDWPDIPMAVRFPKERILQEVRRPYFTNHVAWMIALCITEGVQEIGIFGCEYSSDFERGLQRGSLEYWLGRFEGVGGHVVLPTGSRLLNKPAKLYGYESHDSVTGVLVAEYSGPPKTKGEKVADPEVPMGMTLLEGDPKSWPPLAEPPDDVKAAGPMELALA